MEGSGYFMLVGEDRQGTINTMYCDGVMRKLAYIFGIALFLVGCATLEDLQKQVQQNPNDALAHIDLGIYYVGNKQYQKAITSCKEAIRVNPEAKRRSISGHYCLGYSYHVYSLN